MKIHEFRVILTSDPDDGQDEKLASIFQDGTIATIAGVPLIDFHREADSLVEAIRSAISDVRSGGFEVKQIQLEPDAVLATA